MAGHQAHHVRDSVGRGDGDHAVSHDVAHRHRNSSLTITSNCVNNFTFGNETNDCVATRHHERADIFCMQPARRPLDASFRSYCCDVGSLLPQNAVDGHRHSILQSCGLTAYLISPPQFGGMPWNRFSSTRSISISYRQEAVSEHRGPRLTRIGDSVISISMADI